MSSVNIENYIKNLDDYIIVNQISNHPKFTDVIRFVCITQQRLDTQSKRFELNYIVRCFQYGKEVTSEFIQKRNSIIASESTKVALRDEYFEPVPNPQYVPSENPDDDDFYEKYLWQSGWDMIKNLIGNSVVISELVGKYIIINDGDGYFD